MNNVSKSLMEAVNNEYQVKIVGKVPDAFPEPVAIDKLKAKVNYWYIGDNDGYVHVKDGNVTINTEIASLWDDEDNAKEAFGILKSNWPTEFGEFRRMTTRF